jgi:hypothetical protein
VLTGSVTARGGGAAAPVIDGISARSGVMINQGSTVSFSVAASGNPAPAYQWFKNGTAVPGATRAAFTLSNAQPADAASYTVRATNAGGTVESAGVPVTVFALTSSGGVSISGATGTQVSGTIDSSGLLTGGVTAGGPDAVVAPKLSPVTSSAAATVPGGGSITLVSIVTGNPAPSLQWTRNGIRLPGATNARLAISGATLADAGQYAVIATIIFCRFY